MFLDGYKKLLAFIITLIVSIGAFFGLNTIGASMGAVVIPLGLMAFGGYYIIKQGEIDKKKILATPKGLRSSTPLEQYTQIFIFVLTTAGALVAYFVSDPAKVTTIQGFLVQVVQPLGIIILGLIFSKTASTVTDAKTDPVIPPVVVTPPVVIQPPVIIAPVIPTSAVVSLIKDRIASAVKMINKDTKWDFLMGIWVSKIEAAKQHLLSINPNMTQDDVDSLLAKYAGGILDENDCKNVQSVMGLPAVLHAKNDVLILESMQAAEKAGTLGPAMSTMYLNAAIKGVSNDIVVDGINRVQNDSASIESRRLALQEFGLPKDVADRAMFSGGACQINWMGSWRDFNGYELAGYNPWASL